MAKGITQAHMNTLEEVLASLKSLATPAIITIDGPAGAGKTTLAEILKSELRQIKVSVEIIHMDDLYDGWVNALGSKLARALEDIIAQSESKEIIHPIFNWVEGRYTRVRSIPKPQVLILEGVGAGRSEIREKVDLSIWVEIEPELGIRRAIERDGDEIAPYMPKWSENQSHHFAEHHTLENASFTLLMD